MAPLRHTVALLALSSWMGVRSDAPAGPAAVSDLACEYRALLETPPTP
ncbi:hypothetical protein Misp01_54240 [Microtetraspora sp. NBRC 13810]|nr:hypothetical protein Misp01_54240 [Microtetraspora sp. NBRC 13810]